MYREGSPFQDTYTHRRHTHFLRISNTNRITLLTSIDTLKYLKPKGFYQFIISSYINLFHLQYYSSALHMDSSPALLMYVRS